MPSPNLTLTQNLAANGHACLQDSMTKLIHRPTSIHVLMLMIMYNCTHSVGNPRKNQRLNKCDSSTLKSKNQGTLFVNYG